MRRQVPVQMIEVRITVFVERIRTVEGANEGLMDNAMAYRLSREVELAAGTEVLSEQHRGT